MYSPAILASERMVLSTTTSLCGELGGLSGAVPASAAFPTANLAIFVPVYNQVGFPARQIYWQNGATVTGATSVECALYDELGLTKLLTSGVVTQATVNIPQATVLGTPIYLPRGRYWMGLICSNNTSTFLRYTNQAGVTQMQKMVGTSEQQMGSTALPAAITFGPAAQAYIPEMGVSRSVLVI